MDNSHKNNDTSQVEEFTCDLCGEKFDTVVDLEEHKNKKWHNQLWHIKKDPEAQADIDSVEKPKPTMP